MAKYRNKPVVIEAIQFMGDNVHDVEEFMTEPYVVGDNIISIITLEGTMETRINDWIIKGVAGEFYQCKPDIFEVTYEKVD